ncbi:hypothetical protein HYS54_04475 [Candidatus Micrarchaeota archaeon]|nr:hypothetical protein [Candidatus Micrarchaeota archaeon]
MGEEEELEQLARKTAGAILRTPNPGRNAVITVLGALRRVRDARGKAALPEAARIIETRYRGLSSATPLSMASLVMRRLKGPKFPRKRRRRC